MNNYGFAFNIICLLLAALLLGGCGTAPTAAPVQETPAHSYSNPSAVEASTVDELLAAIKPGATVILTSDSYDLSTASDYGRAYASDYYRWEEVYDGCELVIADVQGLSIIGMNNPVISAVPRYANVLNFKNCDNIYLENFTAGHTTQPGHCAGGVIYLDNCGMISLKRCGLYGCGVLGIQAFQCKGISVIDTEIYECSYGAIQLNSCTDAVFDSCVFRDCGDKDDPCFAAISVTSCENVYILNSTVRSNFTSSLLYESYCKNVFLAGSKIGDNTFSESVFRSSATNTFVIGCSFENNTMPAYYTGVSVCMDADGSFIDEAGFEAMQLKPAKLSELKEIQPPKPEQVLPENRSGYYVTTVDEFLAAIGPDTTIILAEGIFDLSTASSFSNFENEYYYWNDCYDGPALVIKDVSNLSIFYSANNLDGAKNCTIAAVPRYADVLRFEGCDNIVLSGFTAGHTKEPGECSGGVLSFYNCTNVYIDNCRLYGCGTIGVDASASKEITVTGCDIYDCRYYGASLWNCSGVSFENSIIRDIRSDEMIAVGCCSNIKWNGISLLGGNYNIENGVPVALESNYRYDDPEPVYPEYYSISLRIDGVLLEGELVLDPDGENTVIINAESNRPADENLPFKWFCLSPGIVLKPSEDGRQCELSLIKSLESPVLVMVKQDSSELYFSVVSK